MRRYALLVALAALMSLIAQPALAYVIDDSSSTASEPTEGEEGEVIIEEPLPEPTPTAAVIAPPAMRTEQVYFHCSDPSPVGNANLVADSSIPGWNTTPPAGSVTEGNGCLTADVNAAVTVIDPQDNPTDGVWAGTFTGNLRDLTVELHCFMCPGVARALDEGTLGVRLAIDGEPRTGTGVDSYDVLLEQDNSGATQVYRFSVTKINLIEPNTDSDGDGVGDNPTGSIQHTLLLTVDGYDVAYNPLGFWAYDAEEAPSGITFNPTTLAATRIEAG